jgi:hypothetical protein
MIEWPHRRCHDGEVSAPMTGIRQAVTALEQAEKQAREIIAEARLDLGHEIVKARANNVPQKAIAAELHLTREQVRRLEVAAKDAGRTADA